MPLTLTHQYQGGSVGGGRGFITSIEVEDTVVEEEFIRNTKVVNMERGKEYWMRDGCDVAEGVQRFN